MKKKSKIKKEVEEFLAAPDTLIRSEEERKKGLRRKARLEAENKRLKAAKRKEPPTEEDLLTDIIRVAEDEETNPYWKFRSISRRRYELYGWYPVEFVDERYGQWAHAKQVAGLEDQPGTRKRKAAIAETSRRKHAERYVTRFILPYVRKNKAIEEPLRESKLLLSLSDTHSTFLDPFTWQAFLAAIRDLKPDIVYLNGDILEGAEISKYPKIPGWTVPLQLEFDFAREMLRQIREDAGFDGDLIWGGGNHGIDRIAMYLTQSSRAFANLRTMRFDKLAELDGLGVQLAQGGTIASPENQEHDKRGMLLYQFYRIYHGERTGQNHAFEELKDAGRSGQSGHLHKAQVIYGVNEAVDGLSWLSTPGGCTDRAARAYVKKTTTGWQRGFGVCFLYANGDVHQYPVVTNRGRATVEGYVYVQKKKYKPDPCKLWLPDLPRL